MDWEAVERDYRAGQWSLRELKERHGPSPQSILRRAEKFGWQRDLTRPIRAATRAAVVQAQVDQRVDVAESLRKVATVLDADALTIAAAAEIGKKVILQHRAELAESREIGTDLLNQFRQVIIESGTSEVDRLDEPVTGAGRTLLLLGLTKIYEKLVATVTKIQAAERVAHSLDEPEVEIDKRAMYSRMSDIERANRIEAILDTARARRAASALGLTLDESDGALVRDRVPLLGS